MDNQTNNQEPLLNEPINQEPITQEPPILKQPIQPEIQPQPEIEITPEPVEVQPEPEIQPQPETAVPSNEYQPILDQYAANTEKTPVIEEPSRSSEEQLQDLGITNPPSTNNILKIIFTIALIIFILVIVALGFTYFKSQQKSSTIDDLSSTISPTSTPASGACFLNDKTYQAGESFPSADGCNTCSCTAQDSIVCTEKACAPTPTSVATKSATKSTTITPTKTITPTATSSSTR